MPPARILIVEDEGIVAKDIALCLTTLGYSVCAIADSADEAVRVASELRPDLVLMDLMLRGGSDGVTAAATIRQSLKIPVVYLTAYGDPKTVARAKRSDPFGYVLKPFGERDLESAIEIALYRNAVEAKLAESEAHLRLAMDIGQLGTWDLDVASRRIRLAGHGAALLGLPAGADEIVYETFLASVHEDDREACSRTATRALEQRSLVQVEFRLQRPDGTVRWMAARGRVSDEEGGRATKVIGVIQEITERKEAEEARRRYEAQALQAQKDRSLAVLAGGVAHDFNNLLVSILGNAELASLQLGSLPETREMVRQITDAAVSAADLTRKILAYTGQGRYVVEYVDVSALIREQATAREGVVTDLADGLPPVEADAAQLLHIAESLIENAVEAVAAERGTVMVATSLAYMGRAVLAGAITGQDLPEGEYVVLRVADTGPGIPVETLPRVFDPFFTTKFQGRGLGLSATLGITRGHKGAMWIQSAPGRGTTVTVALPPARS